MDMHTTASYEGIQLHNILANETLNILALDNEVATLLAMGLCIQAMGHSVETYSCSKKALNSLSDNSFDVALIDYRLPGGINGVAVINKILEINPETKCFLVTGDHSFEDCHEHINVINKPLTCEKLEHIFDSSNNLK